MSLTTAAKLKVITVWCMHSIGVLGVLVAATSSYRHAVNHPHALFEQLSNRLVPIADHSAFEATLCLNVATHTHVHAPNACAVGAKACRREERGTM